MDDRRFDHWTRSLGILDSRRAAAKALAGGAVAALLARVGLSEAAAKCVKLGKPCEKGDKCCAGAKCKGKCTCTGAKKPCKGKCIAKTRYCKNADCPSGWFCQGGTCVAGAMTCPSGPANCPAPATCGSPCLCLPTPRGTRCLAITPGGSVGECGECNSDPDCVALGFGADSFCVFAADCCSEPGEGFCGTPCPRCIGSDDCPAGCRCAQVADFLDFCVVKGAPCGGFCTDDGDCDLAEHCVNIPECGGFTCRRRCGA